MTITGTADTESHPVGFFRKTRTKNKFQKDNCIADGLQLISLSTNSYFTNWTLGHIV